MAHWLEAMEDPSTTSMPSSPERLVADASGRGIPTLNLPTVTMAATSANLAPPPTIVHKTLTSRHGHNLDKEEVLKQLGRVLVLPVIDGKYRTPVVTLHNNDTSNLYSLVERQLRPDFHPGAEKWWKVSLKTRSSLHTPEMYGACLFHWGLLSTLSLERAQSFKMKTSLATSITYWKLGIGTCAMKREDALPLAMA